MKSLSENKTTLIYVIAVSLLLIYTFFSERGLIRVYELSMERDYIKTKSSKLDIENNILQSQGMALKSNFNEMEKTARAELDLVREDEVLYKFAH